MPNRSRDTSLVVSSLGLGGYLGRAFNMALRTQRFFGANPVTSVPKRKVPKRLPDYLRPEEVVPVLANVGIRRTPRSAGARSAR